MKIFTQRTFAIDQCFTKSSNLESDLELLRNDRLKFLQNPVTNYSNFNKLRKSINDLRLIMENKNINYLAFNKTKLDDSVCNA